MKKFLFTLTLLSGWVFHHSHAQVTVTFKVDMTEYLNAGNLISTAVAMAGNYANSGSGDLPNWDPAPGSMILWKNNIWIRTIHFNGTAFDSLQWKYVRGNSWAAGDEGVFWNPPIVSCVRVNDNNNRKFLLPSNGNIALSSKWARCHSDSQASLQPIASLVASGSTTICNGDSALLVAHGGAGCEFVWMLDGKYLALTQDSAFGARLPGMYTVAVVTHDGVSSISGGISVNLNPNSTTAIVTAMDTTVFCGGDSVVLHGSHGLGYIHQWNLQGISIPGATDSLLVVYQSGTYTLTNSRNGCSVTSPATTVTVHALPETTISTIGSAGFCPGASTVLYVDSGFTYQWKYNGSALPGANNDTLTVSTPGSYSIVMGNQGCFDSSAVTTVVAYTLPQPVVDSLNNMLSTGTFSSYEWLLNGATIPGATNNTYTPTVSGFYLVVVTDVHGCSDTSAVRQITLTGISGTESGSLQVYPNPFEDQLFIRVNQRHAGTANARIMDIQGRCIAQQVFFGHLQITLDSLVRKGMYLLEVQTGNTEVYRTRLVKN